MSINGPVYDVVRLNSATCSVKSVKRNVESLQQLKEVYVEQSTGTVSKLKDDHRS